MTILPPLYSGVSLYSIGLISGLERANIKQSLVIVTNNSAKINLESKRIKFLPVWTRNPKYFFQVFSALLHNKPSVVHFQHEFFLYGGVSSALIFPLLLFFTRLAGMKVIVTMHGVVPRSHTNNQFADAFFVTSNRLILKLGLDIITRLICRISNSIIVHNSYLKEILYQDYNVPKCKIKVIPHGIGENLKNENNSQDNTNSILFFGNITPSKGIEILIQAFEKINVPHAKLIIAGSPHPRGKDYFSKIKKMVEQSPASSNVCLSGYVRDDEIHALFENCSIVVFPYTLAVSSSGGLSFALQHQKPVIVTNLPTFTETITDGKDGLVVPVYDVSALAASMQQLLINTELRQHITEHIREKSSQLVWSVIARKTVECYQQ